MRQANQQGHVWAGNIGLGHGEGVNERMWDTAARYDDFFNVYLTTLGGDNTCTCNIIFPIEDKHTIHSTLHCTIGRVTHSCTINFSKRAWPCTAGKKNSRNFQYMRGRLGILAVVSCYPWLESVIHCSPAEALSDSTGHGTPLPVSSTWQALVDCLCG